MAIIFKRTKTFVEMITMRPVVKKLDVENKLDEPADLATKKRSFNIGWTKTRGSLMNVVGTSGIPSKTGGDTSKNDISPENEPYKQQLPEKPNQDIGKKKLGGQAWVSLETNDGNTSKQEKPTSSTAEDPKQEKIELKTLK